VVMTAAKLSLAEFEKGQVAYVLPPGYLYELAFLINPALGAGEVLVLGEVFYVVSGTIRAVFADLGSGGRETRILEKGMKVRVGTRVGHRFEGIEDSLVIEYSPQYYDKTDALRADLGE